MPRVMVHPRLKRILSETPTASGTPTPDNQSDAGKLEPESEEQDAESEDKVGREREDVAPAESHSSMEISDGDAGETKVTPLGLENATNMVTDETLPASPSQSTPKGRISAIAHSHSHSPPSHSTKEASPAPAFIANSTHQSPLPQPQPRLRIKLKLNARQPEDSNKAIRRRKGKGKEDTFLAFTLPSRNFIEPSEASSHISAESEEGDDADAESEDDAENTAGADDMHAMDVDSRVLVDDIESEGDAGESEQYGRSGSRGRLTARQAVLASMVGAEHVELEAPTSSRKKNLTSEEIALRREETARKRKNMSEKKLQDEKTETINRLLKKQSSRSRAKRSALLNSVVATPQSLHSGDEGESGGEVPMPTFALQYPTWRWVSGQLGMRLGIPPEVVSLPTPALRPPIKHPLCDVVGCAAQRKYRLVHDFQRGACGMEHLRALTTQ